MTLTGHPVVGEWSVAPVTVHHHAPIADFLATTAGVGGRKFAADSRDVAEQLDGADPGATVVLRDGRGRVRGYAALHPPHGADPEFVADFLFDPDSPPNVVDDIVAATVRRYAAVAQDVEGGYLRAFVGSGQQPVIDALVRRGARREGEFVRTRKPLGDESRDALAAAHLDGLTVLPWSEVIARGLGEQVRRLQYDTFLEHFGNMSKTPQAWDHHLHSRAFTPDFSIAAVDDAGEVVGYVLGSTYTSGTAPNEERSAHTDYIGVRRDRRQRGIAELLLRKIWLAALRRGLTLASLGTDIHNRSNAHLLYRRLGYATVEQSYAYRIDTPEETA